MFDLEFPIKNSSTGFIQEDYERDEAKNRIKTSHWVTPTVGGLRNLARSSRAAARRLRENPFV